MTETPDPTIIAAQAHLDQISTHRDNLVHQVAGAWADMPPDARDFAWDNLDDAARLTLTQTLTTAEDDANHSVDEDDKRLPRRPGCSPVTPRRRPWCCTATGSRTP